MDNKNVIEVKSLSKVIKNIDILKDVTVSFEEGKIYGIIGRNGSGKTMFFKAICGLINSSEGSIVVNGELIKNGNFAKDLGVIIENPGFLPQYSANKNLQILASIKNIISESDIKEAIKLVGLDPEDKRQVKKYSLGMKQRLGIAQALMEKPKILILDEPMNSLDEEGVQDIRRILLGLKDKGITILLASHNGEDISILCDKIYVMEKGKLSEKLK